MDTEERSDGDFVTVTLRLIRSFEQRNIKFLVLKNVDVNWTTEQLIEKTFEEIRKSTSLPRPFKTFQYDSMKVEFQPHGAKSSDPVINADFGNFLAPGASLKSAGIQNETEVSFFRSQDFEEYQKVKDTIQLKYID